MWARVSFLVWALCGDGGSTAHRSVTELRYLLSREMRWSQSSSGRFQTTGNILFLSRVEPGLLVSTACSPVTVLAELPRVDSGNCGGLGIRFSSRTQNRFETSYSSSGSPSQHWHTYFQHNIPSWFLPQHARTHTKTHARTLVSIYTKRFDWRSHKSWRKDVSLPHA